MPPCHSSTSSRRARAMPHCWWRCRSWPLSAAATGAPVQDAVRGAAGPLSGMRRWGQEKDLQRMEEVQVAD